MPLPSSLTRNRNSSLVVADLDLDQSGLRVTKGIPQRFRRNLVDLVTKDRVQVPRLSFDPDAECRRRVGARVGRELVAQVLIATARSLRSTVDARKPCTASRPSVIALAAWAIAPSSFSFASAGRSGRRYDAVWKRSNRPWKL